MIRSREPRAARRWISPRIASSSRACSHWLWAPGSGRSGRATSDGSRRPRSDPAGPTISSISSGRRSRWSSRSTSTIGPYGTPAAPMFTHAPRSTCMPRSRARRIASSTSRLLPTPASPARRRWLERPPWASSRAPAIDRTSASRPTTIGLTRRPLMLPMIGAVTFMPSRDAGTGRADRDGSGVDRGRPARPERPTGRRVPRVGHARHRAGARVAARWPGIRWRSCASLAPLGVASIRPDASIATTTRPAIQGVAYRSRARPLVSDAPAFSPIPPPLGVVAATETPCAESHGANVGSRLR